MSVIAAELAWQTDAVMCNVPDAVSGFNAVSAIGFAERKVNLTFSAFNLAFFTISYICTQSTLPHIKPQRPDRAEPDLADNVSILNAPSETVSENRASCALSGSIIRV